MLRSAVKSCKDNLFTTYGHLCLFCDNLLLRVCRELEEYDFRKKVNLDVSGEAEKADHSA